MRMKDEKNAVTTMNQKLASCNKNNPTEKDVAEAKKNVPAAK